MTAKFLNDLLVNSRRFRPTDHGAGKTNATEAETVVDDSTTTDGDENQAHLDRLVRTEESHTQRAAETREACEVTRRKDELLQMLGETVGRLETEQTLLEDRIALFTSVKQDLGQLPAEISSAELRDARQQIRKAHIELTKLSRHAEDDASAAAGQSLRLLTGCSFKTLTRIGLALTWPLLALIVIAVCVVLATLYSLFGV